MNHGSLFSGIGGFDLAAEWMGWENKFHCEIEPFPQTILKHYWPNAKTYTDIKQSDFNIWKGRIDILTGGFPCQPYSTAGKRKGKEDERHLWPEMLRAIREIQPSWIVGENVRGLTNWNGGLVFDEVQADLENAGYEVTPFLLPACGINAPHQRYRIWFIANSTSDRRQRKRKEFKIKDRESGSKKDRELPGRPKGFCSSGVIADTSKGNDGGNSRGKEVGQKQQPRIETKQNSITNSNSKRCRKQSRDTESIKPRQHFGSFKKAGFESWPTQSPICNGDDGISSRLDNITFPKWRSESVKGGGNAIVPQVVYQIFKAIEQYELNNKK